MSATIRMPAVAGSFYSGDANSLKQVINGYLEQADPPALDNVRAVISPHAGYIYSGPIAAFAYKLLSSQAEPPERIILMGPSHRTWFPNVALGDYSAFRTPLGDAPVDQDFVHRLAESSDLFTLLSQAHAGEHCLEVQLPFLQIVYPPVPIVPMLFGEVDPVSVGDALASYLEPKNLIVVSSDLSHYHDYRTACRLDRSFVDAVLRGDKAATAQGEACGQAPTVALMTVAEDQGWLPHLLDYRNSGDTAGDKRQVVGYAAIAYVES